MIFVEAIEGKCSAEQSVEIVERKGTGHPDHMCDSMMEAVSVALSQEYVRDFGRGRGNRVNGIISLNRPLDTEAAADVRRGRTIHEISRDVKAIFERRLAGMQKFCSDLSKGKYPVCQGDTNKLRIRLRK